MRAIGARRTLLSATSKLDAVTRNWQLRVQANGGSVPTTTLAAADIFVRTLRSAGLLSKMRMLNLVAGGNLAGAAVPLINTAGAAKHTLTAFTSGDFSESLGLKTDGSTKYIDTGFMPDGAATMGLALYLRTALTGTSNIPIGCRDSGSTQVYRLFRNITVTTGQIGGSVDQTQVTDTANTPAAFYHDIRTAATNHKLYRGGTQVATSSTSTTPTAITNSMYVFAQNGGSGAAAYCPSNTYIAGYAVDDGTMLAADEVIYYNAWQAFQTSLGRQV